MVVDVDGSVVVAREIHAKENQEGGEVVSSYNVYDFTSRDVWTK
jgi:hypothetical protein